MNCKSCNIDLHPYYQKKYDGYCLNCINAGSAEKDEQISKLERQLAAAERLFEVLRHQDASFNMNNGERLNLLEAIADYANAKGPQ